ncbi:MAG: hypothetical protein QM728_05970 [Gordonia sp. (in: high G+C Gram-positive bacteria)]|uniref:hypothetical protein n=1 Tax=Gordonia sp. (in: high G+C Gram-positive bacteria) TaxID=84139 RepID=UPI0039E34687
MQHVTRTTIAAGLALAAALGSAVFGTADAAAQIRPGKYTMISQSGGAYRNLPATKTPVTVCANGNLSTQYTADCAWSVIPTPDGGIVLGYEGTFSWIYFQQRGNTYVGQQTDDGSLGGSTIILVPRRR